MMNDKNIQHLTITINGRVQGVGFRSAARSIAISLGIKGHVRNTNKGEVVIEAEGTELQLKHLLTWCYKGPSHATVHNVIFEKSEIKGYKFFDIVH